MKNQKGFTLIEMLVVIAIITIIGTISTQIILSLIRSNNKTNIQNEVRQNGAFVIDYLERDIRSASSVVVPSATLLQLTQPDGTVIDYVCAIGSSNSNGDITREGQSLVNIDASTGVKINSCAFTTQNSSPPLVTIDIVITQPYQSPNRSDLTVSQTFHTSVSLRTY